MYGSLRVEIACCLHTTLVTPFSFKYVSNGRLATLKKTRHAHLSTHLAGRLHGQDESPGLSAACYSHPLS
uniref:Uncharacterized protein n=1 Tax=Nelumbo nucifera TaxID=4432 RepID=A0A822Y416_NELNU|nr:TPA_asm: hypothetical protein HUJ06_027253 [Nelumbo nucifera]